MELFDLSGKISVVTGGAGLYGKQIVRALASCGATVYMASRSVQKNIDIAKELAEETGGTVEDFIREFGRNYIDIEVDEI